MPKQSCCVSTCQNYQYPGCGLSFCRFPRDPAVRELWAVRCNQNGINFETGRVCSVHFGDDEFEQTRVFTSGGRRLLKVNAVPSLLVHLPRDNYVAPVPVPVQEDSKKDSDQESNTEVGGRFCVIDGCVNGGRKVESFPFPKDRERSKLWLSCIKKRKRTNLRSSYVCFLHFKEEDFTFTKRRSRKDLQPKRRRLKRTAIPSLNLPCPEEFLENDLSSKLELAHLGEGSGLSCDEEARHEETERDEPVFNPDSPPVAQELLCLEEMPEFSPSPPKNEQESTEGASMEFEMEIKTGGKRPGRRARRNLKRRQREEDEKIDMYDIFAQSKIRILLDENRNLKRKLKASETSRGKLNKQVHHLQERSLKLMLVNQKMKKRFSILEGQLKKLKRELKKCNKKLKKKKLKKFQNLVEEALKDVLTPNQLDIIFKKKKRANWTPEELSVALTIRYLSRRCYLFLRNKLHYPLPGISTLKKWAVTIDLRAGILKDVLNIMKMCGEKKSAFQKTVVLSFDEVKTEEMYEYSKKDDEVLGPHKQAQIVMARGLFELWKQPVFVSFDTKMTKEILLEIITELHKIDYNVVACASDLGGGNQGLWTDFGICRERTFFNHPITNEKIHVFGDAPHLLKLLRNWFLDRGFIIHGKLINKIPIQKLIEMNTSEISSLFKLADLHVDCEKTRRQNVELAAQLFSHTLAVGLKQYLPGEDKEAARLLGEFVDLVNRWFDLFNSYSVNETIPTKKPFGCSLVEQNEILDEMIETVENMICVGKEGQQVFQKYIIYSCLSLKGLYDDMKRKFSIEYIMTHRLNQDLTENLFAQLRTDGGMNDHPTPLTLLYRLRALLLAKNPGMVQKRTNTIVPKEAECDCLVKEALGKAGIQINEEVMSEEEAIISAPEVLASKHSSSTVSISDTMTFIEKDGMEYIAGFLAKKHRKAFPSLGKYTKDIDTLSSHHNYCLPSWIQHLSYGGLTDPSAQWLSQVMRMEKYFRKLHHKDFKFRKGIIKKTDAYISSKVGSSIDPILIKSFCSTRVVIRIKYLNFRGKEKKEARIARRAAKKAAAAAKKAAAAAKKAAVTASKTGVKRKSTLTRKDLNKMKRIVGKRK